MFPTHPRLTRHRLAAATALLCALAAIAPALAYEVTMGTGPRAAYLRIGDGSITGGTYANGGTPAGNTTVNLVSLTVPAASIGNGTDLAMTGSGRLSSDWDNYGFCNAGQVYIGGFYRAPSNNNNQNGPTAVVTYNAPANLTAPGGLTIPITQVRWTSSGNGDTGAQPFPAGSFSPGTNTLTVLNRNRWSESCYSFFYGNDAIVPAGTYDARITYTLTLP